MRCRKILLVLLLFVMPICAFADPGEPCGGEDPFDNECPLDSWVYMLALAPVTVTLVGVFLRSRALQELEKKKREENSLPADHHKKAA